MRLYKKLRKKHIEQKRSVTKMEEKKFFVISDLATKVDENVRQLEMIKTVLNEYGVEVRDIGGRNGWLAVEAFGDTKASRVQVWTRYKRNKAGKLVSTDIHMYVGNVSPIYKLIPSVVEGDGTKINCVGCEKRLEFSNLADFITFFRTYFAENSGDDRTTMSKKGVVGIVA